MTISHKQYTETIVKRFGMTDCNSTEPVLTLSVEDGPTTEDERAAMQRYLYRDIWLAVVSRFDIAFAAGYLGHFSATLGPTHLKAACRALCYLPGNRDYALALGDGNTYDSPLVLTGYSDFDWVRDIDDRLSVSGYVFNLGTS